MGSKSQWKKLRKYDPYKGRIPPPPHFAEEDEQEE